MYFRIIKPLSQKVMRMKEKCKTEKGYKIYNFIIIYQVPMIHLVNLLSSIYIAQNFMTQKVIKLNLFLISKKGNVYIALNIC